MTVDALVAAGIAEHQRGAYGAAIGAFARALQIDATHPIAGVNLGITLIAVGGADDAAAVLATIVAAHPEVAEARVVLGDALRILRRDQEAEDQARAALASAPQSAEARMLYAQLAYERGDFAAAERWSREAAVLLPERAQPLSNLGVIAHGLGRVDDAIAYARGAVALAPDDPSTHGNLAMSLLLGGQYREGFAELEWRTRESRSLAHYARAGLPPRWTGAPLDGGTLLVTRDQGLGDFILFSRFFPLLQARGIRIAVEIPESLFALYADHPWIDEPLNGPCLDAERLAAFAAHVPLFSIPSLLDIDAPVVPSRPYLQGNIAKKSSWRERFAALPGVRVGIVWAGDPGHPLDRFRSLPLAELEPFAQVDGVSLVALQHGPRAADSRDAAFAVMSIGDELRDFSDTAAALAALDLVITVDTSVAHLAGAMGLPVWVLHGFGNFWLWGTERERTPWYPTMRMFRQATPGVWDAEIADVAAALRVRGECSTGWTA